MGSSIGGSSALTGYSTVLATAVKGATSMSTWLTGGDTNWNDPATRNSALWASRVVLQADPAGGSIRYRYDGGAPTATLGLLLTGGDSAVIEGVQNIRNLQIASTMITPGTLIISAERVSS